MFPGIPPPIYKMVKAIEYPSNPNFQNNTYIAISPINDGNDCSTSIPRSPALLPLKLYLAKTYAAPVINTVPTNILTSAIETVFNHQVVNLVSFHKYTNELKLGLSGHIFAGISDFKSENAIPNI